jgi:hypothetical protein
MGQTAEQDAVRAANARCARGEHPHRPADPRVVAFYDAVTGHYPDRGPGAGEPGSPWAARPLHAEADHIHMKLDENCADIVLEMIEKYAAQFRLDLLDLQDGSVYRAF